jgi:hypothetical protein
VVTGDEQLVNGSDPITRNEVETLRVASVAQQAVLRAEMVELKATLRADIVELKSDVRLLDQGGTRGIGGVQSSITDVVKDVADLKGEIRSLKSDMDNRFESHTKVHEDDRKARIDSDDKRDIALKSSRRFTYTTTIAAIVAMAIVISMLVEVLRTLH